MYIIYEKHPSCRSTGSSLHRIKQQLVLINLPTRFFPKNQSSTTSSCTPCVFSPSQSKKIAAQSPVILPLNFHLLDTSAAYPWISKPELAFYFCKRKSSALLVLHVYTQ